MSFQKSVYIYWKIFPDMVTYIFPRGSLSGWGTVFLFWRNYDLIQS